MFLKSRLCVVSPQRQRGIGIPAALFVITLLAILAVAINLLLEQNAETYEEEVSLTRAFYAAESGAGFAMNSIFPPEEFPLYNGAAECAAGPRVYEFTISGLNGCTATVTCSVDATVASVEYYTIVSEGSCDGVTRTVQVRSSGQ
jgi:MSHA biogenesis protein MshP